jgi:hypothetical protein
VNAVILLQWLFFFVVAHLTKSLCEKLPSLFVHHGSCQLTFHIAVFSVTGESGCEFDQIVSWNFFNIICDIGFILKFNMSASPITHSDWLKFFKIFSVTMCVMELLHGRNVPYMTI